MITVAMVSYGSCLESIPSLRSVLEHRDVVRVLVLENNSTKFLDWEVNLSINAGHLDVLNSEKLEVIKSEENLGFGPGVRKLLDLANSKYVLILNPDCRPTPNGLDVLLEHMQNCYCTVLSGTLIKPGGKLDAHMPCVFLPSSKTIMYSRNEFSNFLIRSTFPGALALFNLENLRLAGGYSKIFMYFDEIDTIYKLKRRGLVNHFIDSIVGVHSRGLTTSDNPLAKSDFTAYWATKSSIDFTKRNVPHFLPLVFMSRLGWALKLFLLHQRSAARQVLRGLRDSF